MRCWAFRGPRNMDNQAQDTQDARLAPLVGEWIVEGTHPAEPAIAVRGRASFEWLEGGRFVVERWTVEHPDFPDGIAILGEGESGLAQHYFDSRGVARVYAMSVSDETWELSRDAPGFAQRFVGAFSDDGSTITGRWEKSTDGSDWKLDFHLTYTKSS
jgi:hypothetical protein